MKRSAPRALAALSILVASPGLDPYRAFAAVVAGRSRAGGRASVHAFKLPSCALSSPLKAPSGDRPALAPRLHPGEADLGAGVAVRAIGSVSGRPSGAEPAPAFEQLAQLDASTALSLSQDGEVSLQAKVEGDKLFDMRREQVGAQWSAVAEGLDAMRASLPKSKLGAQVALADELARLKSSRRAGSSLSIDAELGAPIKGAERILELAAEKAETREDFVELFYGMFSGYTDAILTLAGAERVKPIVNDVTQINPVAVDRVLLPETVEEIRAAVRNNPVISVGGGHYSMGGQTATEGVPHLDLRRFNKILEVRPKDKTITVQAGVTWRQVLEALVPHEQAPKIMQSYANFTVGGSLSVNVHGRYVGLGPLIMSVRRIKVALADGRLVTATPKKNKEIFYGAIGGYGALGVIVEATLDTADNVKVGLRKKIVKREGYREFFDRFIRNDPKAVFHNADFTPDFKRVRAVTWAETDEDLEVEEPLRAIKPPRSRLGRWMQDWVWGPSKRLVIWGISTLPRGKWRRHRIWAPLAWIGKAVVMRSYEASYAVQELEPGSRSDSTYVLEEYFVPIGEFDTFVPKMAEIFKRHDSNVINVSVRHAKKDPGSKMAWAREEMFAFVVYYKQGTQDHEKEEVAVWTRELIEAAIASRGTYYLPYQLHATQDQFYRAYPNHKEFFELKRRLDPFNKFRNKLLDKYYKEWLQPAPPLEDDRLSAFKTIYGKSVVLRDAYYKFLQVIYHMRPAAPFHHLIMKLTARLGTDKEIYQAIQKEVGAISPWHAIATYGIPSLLTQRREMVEQTAKIIGPIDKKKPINGYVEIGTTGRYATALKKRLGIKGPIYIINDAAGDASPTYSPQSILERGRFTKVGAFYGDLYEPISQEQIPDASVDLVTIYIGTHHSPIKKLDPWIRSINRVLRPGGRLIVRDHDARDEDMNAMAALAHDVYNAGFGLTWEKNAAEIRFFTSVEGQSKYLEDRGFKDAGKRLLQANDPTLNTLMEFVKIAEAKPGFQPGRGTARSFLTYPEWSIVYDAREYAEFVKKNPPSRFPYFRAIARFWDVKADMEEAAAAYYKDKDVTSMIAQIGIGQSLIHFFNGIYEKTFGRAAELLGGTDTAEDWFARRASKAYAEFMDREPWYRFPFFAQIKKLWTEVPITGPNPVRKWERRLALSAGYALMGAGGWAMTKMNGESYDPGENQTLVLGAGFSDEALAKAGPNILDRKEAGGAQLIAVKRYQPFTEVVPALARAGGEFKEIAGNDVIMVTLTAPSDWTYAGSAAKVVSRQPVFSGDGRVRVALKVPVASLSAFIGRIDEMPAVSIEHVYDY